MTSRFCSTWTWKMNRSSKKRKLPPMPKAKTQKKRMIMEVCIRCCSISTHCVMITLWCYCSRGRVYHKSCQMSCYCSWSRSLKWQISHNSESATILWAPTASSTISTCTCWPQMLFISSQWVQNQHFRSKTRTKSSFSSQICNIRPKTRSTCWIVACVSVKSKITRYMRFSSPRTSHLKKPP